MPTWFQSLTYHSITLSSQPCHLHAGRMLCWLCTAEVCHHHTLWQLKHESQCCTTWHPHMYLIGFVHGVDITCIHRLGICVVWVYILNYYYFNGHTILTFLWDWGGRWNILWPKHFMNRLCSPDFQVKVIWAGIWNLFNAGASSPTLPEGYRRIFNVHQLMPVDGTPSFTLRTDESLFLWNPRMAVHNCVGIQTQDRQLISECVYLYATLLPPI